jgi:hypothetical protein
MDMSYWGRIERGTIDPGLRAVTRIAVALETTPAELFAGIDPVSNQPLPTRHLGEHRPALILCRAMPSLRLAPPGPSVVSCDCCLQPIPAGAPMATVEVVGPDNRDEAHPLGDYCGPCWRTLSAAWDVLEELGRPRPEAHT